MMNYTIKTDSEELRNKILNWLEINICPPWTVTIDTWSPDDDDEGKWASSSTAERSPPRERVLSAFKGELFSIQESGESYQ
jgi:hypothetical protein